MLATPGHEPAKAEETGMGTLSRWAAASLIVILLAAAAHGSVTIIYAHKPTHDALENYLDERDPLYEHQVFGFEMVPSDGTIFVIGVRRQLGMTHFVAFWGFIRDDGGVDVLPLNNASASSDGAATNMADGSGAGGGANGPCVVGYQDAGTSTPFHAFRRSSGSSPVDLGTLVPASNASLSSFATAVSADCTVVTGMSELVSGGVTHAFRWTQAGGMVDLGAPAGVSRTSQGLDVSRDGSVIVGSGEFADANAFSGFRNGAFRWTAAGGFQNLGALEPGFFSLASAVSGDGTVVVGQGGVQILVGNSSTNGSRAFRWTQAQGMQAIGPLTGHTAAAATGVSDNGKVVVGTSSTGPLQYRGVVGGGGFGTGTAFRWTEATGIQDLRQLLVAGGVDLTGIAFVAATDVSADGQFITVKATTPTTQPNEVVTLVVQVCDDAIGATCATLNNGGSGGGAATFSVATSTPTLAVAAGQSATATLTITPGAGFSGPVSFACSGLPQGAACTFAPPTVTPTSGPVSTTLTVTTDGGPIALRSPALPATVALASIGLLGIRLRRAPRGRRRPGLWVAACAVALVGSITSCGGGGGGGGDSTGNAPAATGTPAGTSNVTVTATSGSGASAVTRTLPIALTVTR